MNKYLYLCLVVVVAGVAVIGYWKPYQEQASADDIVPTARAETALAVRSDAAHLPGSAQSLASLKEEQAVPAVLQDRMDAIQMRRPHLAIDASMLQAKVAQPAAWSKADSTPTHLPLKPEEFTDGRHFVAIDDLKIETLVPGDVVEITIPDTNNTHELTIDNVEKHDYASITWHGHIAGSDGQTYSGSITRGDVLTVAGFDTPDGHYVLQGHGKDGWIASSALLFKEHMDPIRPEDVLKAEGIAGTP